MLNIAYLLSERWHHFLSQVNFKIILWRDGNGDTEPETMSSEKGILAWHAIEGEVLFE